ncbi:uncharacterized protein ACR2FA_006100 [Aphomia sociella]
MLSKFNKNVIYSGAIDYYCLVCEEYLKTEREVEAHIEKKIHKKDLDLTPYFEEQKEECIRKVKAGYYCELCNDFFSNPQMAKLHRVDAAHKSKKILITRSNNSIIAKDVFIDEKTWNGFSDNTCYICDTEFSDVNIHRSQQKHILNLIQSKIEYGDTAFYRKVNSTNQELFHCLTCNELVSVSHFESNSHKEKYQECLVSGVPSISNANTAQVASDQKNTSTVQNVNGKQTNEAKKKKKANKKNTANTKNINAEVDEFVCNKLGAKNYIIDKDGKQWCILCDWILDRHAVDAHVKSLHHTTLLKFHKSRFINKAQIESNAEESDAEESMIDAGEETVAAGEAVCDKLLDSTTEFERNSVNINLVMRTAYCKKCSKNLEFQYEFIKNHIETHKSDNSKLTEKTNKDDKHNNATKGTTLITKPVTMKQKNKEEKPVNTPEDEDALRKFAKNNDLILKNNRYYCSVCSISLNTTLKCLEDHISGFAHKNRIHRQTKISETKLDTTRKVAMKVFMKTVNMVENVFFKDFVINDKYCINVLSFYMFTIIGNGLRCHPCDETFACNEADVHKISDKHARKMEDTLVLTSIDGEFVREVKLGLLHCGYCNLVIDDDDMYDHLKSTSHEESKRSATSRLEKYLPGLLQQRRTESVFMDMMKNSLPF